MTAREVAVVLWGTGIGQFFFSIRKQHTVNKGTRVQGTCSEYFRGVVFSYSFSIYCAANHGILCSDTTRFAICLHVNSVLYNNIFYHFLKFCLLLSQAACYIS